MKNNKYTVYTISVNDEVVYVGMTKDLKRRQTQHRYSYRRSVSKELYSYFSSISLKEEEIVLEPIKTNITELQAKILECYIILSYYFSGQPLKQSLPKSIFYHR